MEQNSKKREKKIGEIYENRKGIENCCQWFGSMNIEHKRKLTHTESLTPRLAKHASKHWFDLIVFHTQFNCC